MALNLRFLLPRIFGLAVIIPLLPPLHAETPAAEQKYVAIFTSNANVDGVSYKKGYQVQALGFDKVSAKVTIRDKGATAKVPVNYVRVVSEEQAGVTIIEAEYGVPGQRAKNVTATLQRKLDGQQKISLVVSGAEFGVRTQQQPMMAPPSGGGSKSGFSGKKSTSQNMPTMPNGGMTSMAAQTPATLSIQYSYKGTTGTASAPEGQTISIP